jgi:hypothetical protein
MQTAQGSMVNGTLDASMRFSLAQWFRRISAVSYWAPCTECFTMSSTLSADAASMTAASSATRSMPVASR